MKLNVEIEPAHYYNGIHELLRLAFFGWEVRQNSPADAEASLRLRVDKNRDMPRLVAEIIDQYGRQEYSHPLDMQPEGMGTGPENILRREIRLFVYKFLCAYTGRNINAYGLLTGMRPVKAAQKLLDATTRPEELETLLAAEYRTDKDKSALLAEVARNSRPYLCPPGEMPGRLSMYVGIPYCPSRCHYCSFPGAVLRDYLKEIPPFLECLNREIAAMSTCLAATGLEVDNIYLGGGTPTVLNSEDLSGLLISINQAFPGEAGREISVEAGRPDTLDRQKLEIMAAAGVRRICINPQSMQDQTLIRIGRLHDSAAVEKAVADARQAGFATINMDLIAGLEGEELAEIEASCQRVLKMRPENVTVHSLAVKKGSRLAIEKGLKPIRGGEGMVERALRYFERSLRAAGYQPYYLYRQKYMRDNMENIGYSLPGHVCRYNVQMIEERQSILGIGGGASSKFVDSAGQLQGVFYNPKDPYFYCRDIERLVQAKVDKLRALI